MKKIYVDSSFNWRTKNRIGKVCVYKPRKKFVKEIECPKIPNLKQYNNYLELRAVLEGLRSTEAKEVLIVTDSQVAQWWVERGIGNKHKAYHDLYGKIKDETDKLNYFSIVWFPRDKNKAGVYLDDYLKEQKKSYSHDAT